MMSKSEIRVVHSKKAYTEAMNLRQIEAFRAVVRMGSATAAGELLRLTQPTVSKLIAQLERETGLTLFDRERKRLIPRHEAHALLQHVEKVFGALEEVSRGAKQLARRQVGNIRIITTPTFGASFVPKAVAEFAKTHPDVSVRINVRTSSYVNEWIAGQRADIGLAAEGPIVTGMVADQFRERLAGVCVLPKRHPLAGRKVLQPKDFANQRFVSLGRDTTFRHLIDRAFQEAGIDRTIVAETNSFATACMLIAQGDGVGIVNPFSALDCYDGGQVVLRPFQPEIKFAASLLRPASQSIPLIVEEFISTLAKRHRTMTRRLRETLLAGL
jgi:DNA-binding transcriptional LysR family regulator